MPTYEIIGKRIVDYKRKSDGQQVNGYEFHLTYKDENVDGLGAMSVFVRSENLDEPLQIGDRVHVLYNRWGRVETLQLAG